MNNKRKNRGIWDSPKVLDEFPFLDNRVKTGNNICKTLIDIKKCLELPCEKHPHSCYAPYERLTQKGDDKIVYLRACERHAYVITATITIDASWRVECGGFESCVERMVCNTFGTIHHSQAPYPDTP